MELDAAVADVAAATCMVAADGAQLPQTSRPGVVRRLLDLLDVSPGMRVLEIGTGSGYSTALLSRLVGPAGHVRSVDIDRDLVARADALLRADGARNVLVVHGDGRTYRAEGPLFDRLIAWGTPAAVPAGWVEQVRTGGLVVTPLRRERACVVRLRVVGAGGAPRLDAVAAGSFVPVTAEPFRPCEQDGGPEPRADISPSS